MDVQAGGRQSVTVEDSMSMVHASRGLNAPAAADLKSEPAIIAGIAEAAIEGGGEVDWKGLVGDYDLIRDAIEATFPEAFADYNGRIRKPGGFRLPVPASARDFGGRRARFMVSRPDDPIDPQAEDPDVLVLTTVRSHGQYNTTVYGFDDRYRGVFGSREVVFMSPQDMAERGLSDGDRVDLSAASDSDGARVLKGFVVLPRELPKGCVAAYYPETNLLVRLDDRDRRSGTPAYKSVPVRVWASRLSK
jgi:anaerobic selenocysteine-containing dehydrogenase